MSTSPDSRVEYFSHLFDREFDEFCSSEYWDKISPIYDQLYFGTWSQFEDFQTQNWLASVLSPRDKISVLDLACGTGLGMSLLKNLKYDIEYSGVDVSREMLSHLQRKFPMARVFRCSLANPSQWPSGPFDLVLALNGVLSFSKDIEETLAGIRSRMTRESIAFVSVFNRWAIRRLISLKFSTIESFRTRGADHSLGSVYAIVYSENELRDSLKVVGLQLKHVFRQGCLAGFLEWPSLWPFEIRLQKSLPWGSHLLSFSVQSI